MSQEIRLVTARVVDQKCSCGNGYMRPNGIVHTGVTPLYEHVCETCGRKENYPVRYPINS